MSQVKFLEGRLEQAKHAESGRNALVKKITRLEEEVKHSRHRLEIRHAEALVSVKHLLKIKPCDQVVKIWLDKQH